MASSHVIGNIRDRGHGTRTNLFDPFGRFRRTCRDFGIGLRRRLVEVGLDIGLCSSDDLGGFVARVDQGLIIGLFRLDRLDLQLFRRFDVARDTALTVGKDPPIRGKAIFDRTK